MLLALRGCTSAPAETLEGDAVADLWKDLGTRWRITEQYLKPYPVCRWALPAIAAALRLYADHAVDPKDVRTVRIGT